MRLTEANPNFNCPVEATLHVIGGKWKAALLFRLLEHGTLRFNELRRQMPPVTLQTLTNALRELEADGIVHREVYPQVPPKVEYSLTPRGHTLAPILQAMCDWGVEFGDAEGSVWADPEKRQKYKTRKEG